MSEVSASAVIGASLAEVWEFYFDIEAWPLWVDGFGGVDSVDGYPLEGGTLSWHSLPAGRGKVTERVLEHAPRSLHRVAFSDPESTGEQTACFAIEPGGEGDAIRVTLAVRYELNKPGLFGGLVDWLFVRSQVRGSLQRSLSRLRLEIEQRRA